MSWKQPITTACIEFDTITRIVFMEIMIHLRNSDMVAPKEIWNGNQRHLIQLKKYQCIFNIERFSRESGISKKAIKKSLDILINLEKDNIREITFGHKTEKPLTEISKNIENVENREITWEITRKSFGLIITALNGDDLLSFGNHLGEHSEITRKSLGNHSEITRTSNNKSVNPVKSVDIVDTKGEEKENKPNGKKEKHFDSVFLTKDEYEKLKERFGDLTQSLIENLNNYIMSTGKQYKSHYHTILNWQSKNNKKEEIIPQKKFTMADAYAD